MYVLIAGGGKAGANVMRTLLRNGHEATIIEQDRDRFERLEAEFEHQAMNGDGTELFVLEKAGIKRPPDLVLALTGDDEDNLVIAQLAKEKYGVPEGDRARQRPAQPAALRPARHLADGVRDLEHPRLVEHEVPEHDLDPPARAAQGEPRDRRGADRQELAERRQDGREAAAAGRIAA
jgi:trk system potassium uptake protein TrkA